MVCISHFSFVRSFDLVPFDYHELLLLLALGRPLPLDELILRLARLIVEVQPIRH